VFFGAAEDVSEPTLLQLFSRHGDVTGLFLVRSALGLPSGCGYMTMASAEQAAAALAALQGSSECAEAGGKLGLLIVQLAAQDSQQPTSPEQQQQEEAGSSAPVKDVRTVRLMQQMCRTLHDICSGGSSMRV
jgi:RNA recognition motif-containing protein